MILSNKRALRGEKTFAVILSLNYMNAVFNIEKDFHSGRHFTLKDSVEENNRSYQLDHLTYADLQLAFILQKACFTNGYLTGLTAVSNVYDKICDYFEEPIGRTQFYASFEKFQLHGLIHVIPEKDFGTLTIKLNHYLSEETGTIGAFVKGHPVLFSKVFGRLPVCSQKLFLTFCLQQGVKPEKGKMTFRMFSDTTSNDIQYGAVTRFLHCSPAHVNLALRSLQEAAYTAMSVGKMIRAPLLDNVRLDKKRGSRSFERVFVSVNPFYFTVEEPEGNEYHDMIGLRITYKKKANLLQKLLDDYGIGEIAVMDKGRCFHQMVRILRNESAEVIRYIVRQLYDKYITKELRGNRIITFLQDELRFRFKARVMAMTKTSGINQLVTAGHPESDHEKADREFDFASSLSRFSERTIRTLFTQFAAEVKSTYMRPIREKDLHYRYDAQLDEVRGMDLIRKTAIKLYKEPEAYLELEKEAAVHYAKHISGLLIDEGHDSYYQSLNRFRDWLMKRVYDLPEVRLVPDVEPGFRLENIILELAGRPALQ